MNASEFARSTTSYWRLGDRSVGVSDPFEPNDEGEYVCDCGATFETVAEMRDHVEETHDTE